MHYVTGKARAGKAALEGNEDQGSGARAAAFGTSAPSRAAVIAPLSAARWLLLLVLAAGVYFFHGFLVPVLAALVIAFASWPLYRKLLDAVGGSRTVAASVALLLILAFLIIPIMLAGSYAITEIEQWVGWALETNRNGAPTPAWITQLPAVGDWLDAQWTAYLAHPGGIGEIIQLISGANIGTIYRGVVAAGGSAFGVLLTLPLHESVFVLGSVARPGVTVVALHFTLSDILTAIGMGAALGAVCSLIPAWYSTRFDVKSELRVE